MSNAPAVSVTAPRLAGATGPLAHLDKVLATVPPPPAGVTDLRFSEIYRSPVGPRGLEFTDKLRSLDGKRVRLLGYMIKQTQPMPWTMLFSPLPMTLHEREYGFAEDLPPQTIHVLLQKNSTPILPHTPGLMLLTGHLELGTREEPDGRVSQVRLHLDPPTPEQRRALEALATGAAPGNAPKPLSTPRSAGSVAPGKLPSP